MESKANYTVVGLSVLLLTLGLLITALWLSVGFDQKKYKIYAVYLHEAVSGLSEESTVKFNGVPVGTVLKIKLNPSDPQQVKLLLKIEEDTPITTSTTATLMSQGITGVSYLGLSASSSDLTPLEKIPNEPYPIIPTRPSLFNQLDGVIKDVSENINRVAERINQLLDDENTLAVKKTLTNFQTITDTFAENKANIYRTLQNADTLTKNLSAASRELPQTIKELRKTIDKLGAMANSVGRAGLKVGSVMDSSKVAINKLSQQTIPPVNILIKRLDNIAANLQQVSSEIRQNPSIVIRGTTTAKPGPGE